MLVQSMHKCLPALHNHSFFTLSYCFKLVSISLSTNELTFHIITHKPMVVYTFNHGRNTKLTSQPAIAHYPHRHSFHWASAWRFPRGGRGLAWRNGKNQMGRVLIPVPKGLPLFGLLFSLNHALPHHTLASMASTISATKLMAFEFGVKPNSCNFTPSRGA
ncbi:hypothetical protein ACSQ67_014242 [Phaseolus vulgaris]